MVCSCVGRPACVVLLAQRIYVSGGWVPERGNMVRVAILRSGEDIHDKVFVEYVHGVGHDQNSSCPTYHRWHLQGEN